MGQRSQRDAWLSYPGAERLDLQPYCDDLVNGRIEPGHSPGTVAALLGVSRDAVTKLAKRGVIAPRVVLDQDGELAVVEFPLSAVEAVRNRPERSKHDPRKRASAA